jgi:uncharacterized protein YjaG (DUF416 family)
MDIKESLGRYCTKKTERFMDYMKDLINHSNLSGSFLKINLIHEELMVKHGFIKFKGGVKTQGREFREKVLLLRKLGIIKLVKKATYYNNVFKAGLYSIDKEKFVIYYLFFKVINSLNNREGREARKSGFHSRLNSIVNEVILSIHNGHIYIYDQGKSKIVNTILNRFYLLSIEVVSLLESLYSFNYPIYTFNSFYSFYSTRENISNSFLTLYINNPLIQGIYVNNYVCRLNNIGGYMVQKSTLIDRVWVSDVKTRSGLIENLSLYENYGMDKIKEMENNVISYLKENVDLVRLPVIRIPTRSFIEELEILGINRIMDIYKEYLISNSPLIKYLLQSVDLLVTDSDNYRITLKTRSYEGANGYGTHTYYIYLSGRMYNTFCSVEKADKKKNQVVTREHYLEGLGFDSQFDISSTIFTIALSINNKLPINLVFDIKQELENLNLYGSVNGMTRLLKRADYKGLLFYVFFSDNDRNALSMYKNRFNAKFHSFSNKVSQTIINEELNKIHEKIPNMSDEQFLSIYSFVQSKVGPTQNFKTNIFFLESCIEARVINRLKSLNKSIKNVYDCFFYKQSELSEMQLKEIIYEEAQKVFAMYERMESGEVVDYV